MRNNVYLHIVKRIFIKIKTYPYYFILLLLSSIIIGLNTIISIQLLNYALNITSIRHNDLWKCITLLILLLIIEISQNLIMNRILPVNREKVIFHLYTETYKIISYSKLSEYDDDKFLDDVHFSLTYGIKSILDILDIFASLVGYIVSLVGVIRIIITYDFDIIIILLIGLLIITFVGMKMKRLHRNATIEKMNYKRREDYIRRMFTLKEHNHEMQIFDTSDFLINKLRTSYKEKIDIINKYGKKGFFIANIISIITHIYQFCILANLIYKNIIGMINIAGVAVSYYAIKRLETQLISIIDIFPSFYEKLIYAKRYFEFFDNRKSMYSSSGEFLKKVNKISLENLEFSYGSRMILNGVNLSFEDNGKYVIVGKNGAGKTTLIKLINGMLEPQKGKVKINNIDISKIDNSWRKKHMSMALQEYTLFSASILENIALKTKEKANLHKVENALKMVGLDKKINNLSMGIDTIISKEFSKDGEIFSQGEKQRLVIARAYATGADILLLDEPLSNVDEISSEEIMNAINEISKEKMIIYISHNDKYIKMSDWIIVIDDNGNVDKFHNSVLDNIYEEG